TDGVVYATADSGFRGMGFGGSGFSTVDASDPDRMTVISDSDANRLQQLGKLGIAVNGTDLAVLAGEPARNANGTSRQNELDVMSVADLSNTANLITRLPLPGLPRSVALASGFAFAADDVSGLQVVGIVPLDTGNVAPTAAIAAAPPDADPAAPGVQVI